MTKTYLKIAVVILPFMVFSCHSRPSGEEPAEQPTVAAQQLIGECVVPLPESTCPDCTQSLPLDASIAARMDAIESSAMIIQLLEGNATIKEKLEPMLEPNPLSVFAKVCAACKLSETKPPDKKDEERPPPPEWAPYCTSDHMCSYYEFEGGVCVIETPPPPSLPGSDNDNDNQSPGLVGSIGNMNHNSNQSYQYDNPPSGRCRFDVPYCGEVKPPGACEQWAFVVTGVDTTLLGQFDTVARTLKEEDAAAAGREAEEGAAHGLVAARIDRHEEYNGVDIIESKNIYLAHFQDIVVVGTKDYVKAVVDRVAAPDGTCPLQAVWSKMRPGVVKAAGAAPKWIEPSLKELLKADVPMKSLNQAVTSLGREEGDRIWVEAKAFAVAERHAVSFAARGKTGVFDFGKMSAEMQKQKDTPQKDTPKSETPESPDKGFSWETMIGAIAAPEYCIPEPEPYCTPGYDCTPE